MKPRALDLFCGAGGATAGLQRAGFHVTGVDVVASPRYCGDAFVQADALDVDLGGYAFIWASPPCQAYSAANNIHRCTTHPDLVDPVRARLERSTALWCIENVPGAPLRRPVLLCGLSLGLGVKRHRLFECGGFTVLTPPCGDHRGDWLLVFGHTVLERGKRVGTTPNGGTMIQRKYVGVERGRAAMGIDWMNRDELSQAVPPAYAEFIGRQALAAIKEAA